MICLVLSLNHHNAFLTPSITQHGAAAKRTYTEVSKCDVTCNGSINMLSWRTESSLSVTVILVHAQVVH